MKDYIWNLRTKKIAGNFFQNKNMSYLQFDKNNIVNLDYSLSREIIRSNRGGTYSSRTIVGCNTRKYHGVLVCPIEEIDGDRHVLLSSLDVTVVQHDAEFNFGIHKYPGEIFHPNGHKYIRNFEIDKTTKTTYRVGGVVLTRESLLISNEEQVIIKFTLEEANSPTKLRLRPFLAFRNHHALSKANMYANTKVDKISNGVKSRLYNGYPALHMQLSKANEFLQVPDWFYNIEYQEEQIRGYDYQEDLFVPGYFEVPIKKGESIYFSASLKESAPASLSRKFISETDNRIPRDSYFNCLKSAAQQFIVRRDKKVEIIAGFHWFGSWGRDTFISLPGLTLALDDDKTCKSVIDTQVSKLKDGLFPNMGSDENPAFNSVDAPLWFFWSLQEYAKYTKNASEVWDKYSKPMKAILNAFKNGMSYNIKMHENGLIWAGEHGKALTWMDAVVFGKPATPRMGYDVEINALWYNAICFCLELAKEAKDNKFTKEWKDMPSLIADSYVKTFWSEEKGYLADYVDGNYKDWSVRPNQVIAAALDYSPIEDDIKRALLDKVEQELLTPRGLRTLSPKNENYIGIYEGDQPTRDNAYHNGTVWPWLLEPFCRAYLNIHKKSGISLVQKIYNGFEEEMTKHGVGTIAEIYDGDPPHQAKGAISQAWSVAALLRINKMIEEYCK